MSFWHQADGGGEERSRRADEGDEGRAPSARSSNIGDRRQTMNTPAVTMVAAWISAETGVGPSIASGSQVCRPSCADLPIAPMNSSRQSTVSVSTRHAEELDGRCRHAGAAAKTVSKSTRAEDQEDAEDAEREAEIADAVDDEGLDRGGVGRWAGRTRSRSAGRSRGPRLPSRRTSARSCRPSPASAWRR